MVAKVSIARSTAEKALLDAAERVLVDAGYAGITTRRLAEEAGVNHGLVHCNITKCCSEVCPEGIHLTDNGIIPLKERVVDRRYDPLTWLGSKIGRRPRE